MVNIFLFHRDLRIQDNTTLIHQIKTLQDNSKDILILPMRKLNIFYLKKYHDEKNSFV